MAIKGTGKKGAKPAVKKTPRAVKSGKTPAAAKPRKAPAKPAARPRAPRERGGRGAKKPARQKARGRPEGRAMRYARRKRLLGPTRPTRAQRIRDVIATTPMRPGTRVRRGPGRQSRQRIENWPPGIQGPFDRFGDMEVPGFGKYPFQPRGRTLTWEDAFNRFKRNFRDWLRG
jgi:hypothetical protein